MTGMGFPPGSSPPGSPGSRSSFPRSGPGPKPTPRPGLHRAALTSKTSTRMVHGLDDVIKKTNLEPAKTPDLDNISLISGTFTDEKVVLL